MFNKLTICSKNKQYIAMFNKLTVHVQHEISCKETLD